MRAVVQRVKNCNMNIKGELFSHIDRGLLCYIGIKTDDTIKDVEYLAQKLVKLRIFKDGNGKLNKSVQDIGGEIMIVSNFTIYGSVKGTNRPDFSKSASYDYALPLYKQLIKQIEKVISVKTGIFGENMQVEYVCDGPINLVIES